MNTVPFDQLGPGQSGRLAYQVLGQDGAKVIQSTEK